MLRRQAHYLADAIRLAGTYPFRSQLSYGETESGKPLPLPRYTSLVAHRDSLYRCRRRSPAPLEDHVEPA